MSSYDGVVTLAEDDIPVIIELDDDIVRLSASGTEIGKWAKDECEIRHVANSTYAIRAENETLSFVPNQPVLFAAAVDSSNGAIASIPGVAPDRHQVREAPPPKPLTMGLFYALGVLTAGLAIWAVVSMLT